MFELNNIRVNRGGRDILRIDQLTIDSGAFTMVLGHNGSGKSTLVNLLAGQMAPDEGDILLNQQPLTALSAKALAREVAFLPQKLPEVAGLTVRELVKLGRFPWRGTFGRWQKDDVAIIEAAMRKTGTLRFADNLADQLSGGERQRAWVSMLLAQQSPVLILDEPTSALDIHHQYQLMSLLADLNRDTGCGVIVILHDLNLALRFATHVVALKQGRIAFTGPKDVLLDEPRLSALYETDIKLIDHPVHSEHLTGQKVAVVCE
ncbi:ABC transporter ATP-binding protein [Photobacterium halotolerans]|uniref:ABC transporter n=1 Tax=Photobacterium halotolerans TaxID=265726 RepID=A0A0F5VB93_9GAMM|nr:ABC transporter ATP-binding protein [Photobacterium halotolerans]KKC98759.1 ABC transporter [Photobacterium halotolerans]